MADAWAPRATRAGAAERDERLPPVLLPFTLQGGPELAAPGATDKSVGHHLGLYFDNVDDAGGGVVITALRPGGPAAAEGTARVGDFIVEVDGVPVREINDILRPFTDDHPRQLVLGLRQAGADAVRQVTLRPLPRAPRTINERGSIEPARVPTTTLLHSLQRHIECILSNPLQGEVMHEGVPADPGFGCLGADLEFSIQRVGLAAMMQAIIKNEPRLRDVSVAERQLEVRVDGETLARPGIRVEGKLATWESVTIDLEIREITSRRRAYRLRRRSDDGDASR